MVPPIKAAWPKLELIHDNKIIIYLKKIVLLGCFNYAGNGITSLIQENIFDA